MQERGALVLAAVMTLVALFAVARGALERWARARAIRARVLRAMDGESRAEPILRRAGYDVLARQVPGEWTLFADGAPMAVALRADLLVAKHGRRYVAEVKTGKLAPRLDHAPTRRQLLEYRAAFDVDGVLLVDAEADRVVEVQLGAPAIAAPPPSRWIFAFAAGLAIGALAMLAAERGAIVTAILR